MISPICCVIGHVDVGKTKLLDKLRESNIQANEVGGITQQIGSTYFSKQSLIDMSEGLHTHVDISGLLIIDTPGHDCFTQMRMIGVKVSHLAIVVVDIMKGLEKQTIQAIELLKTFNTQFVIVMNKVDRLHGWVTSGSKSLKKCLEKQKKDTLRTLKECANRIIAQIANLEINACLYYENKNINEYVSMVPVSSVNGDGIADLIVLISKLTSKNLKNKLDTELYKNTHGYILDIKKDNIHGFLCHTILTTGNLKRNDEILLESMNNKIYTAKIKDIFLPEESKEMKNKSQFKPQSEVEGTIGVALKFDNNQFMEELKLGGLIIKKENNTNLENLFDNHVNNNIGDDIITNYNYEKHGIIINVPAKSMANAVIQLLKNENNKFNIPVSEIHVGQITKTMIIKVSSNNQFDKNNNPFEHEYYKRYSVILDYNNNYSYSNGGDIIDRNKLYDKNIIEFCDNLNVNIISDSVIYGLFTHYKKFIENINNKLRTMYPNIIKEVKLKIFPQFIFMKKSPLLFGVKILNGELKKNNILEARNNDKIIKLGKVVGLQKNKKNVESAKAGDEICIRIETTENIEYGKHFDADWLLYNYLTHEEVFLQKKYSDVFN